MMRVVGLILRFVGILAFLFGMSQIAAGLFTFEPGIDVLVLLVGIAFLIGGMVLLAFFGQSD